MKRWLILLLTASMLFSLCACKSAQESATASDTTPATDASETQTQPVNSDSRTDESDDTQNDEQPSHTMYVYTADGSGSFAVSEESVSTCSPATLIGALAHAGVLNSDVSANSMENISGGMVLDLNTAFQTQLTDAGEEGEPALLGCVVNSFLKTFDGQGILITVNHETLMGASEAYDYYQSMVESYPASAQAVTTDTTEESENPEIPEVEDAPEQFLASSTAEAIVELAKSLEGAAFEWGASGPDTFDNSGFVCYCFAQNGVIVPRITSDMLSDGLNVERESLLPGDLVFFSFDGSTPNYVGIYIGDGKFIAENSEESPVAVRDMSAGYYSSLFVCARRYA